MKIQKLKLCNFSSYEGENEFDFTVNGNHSVVLIGGQNGAGKTSLFTAIKIALYGPLAFGYTGMNSYYVKRIKDQINTKAFQNDILFSYVSIDIAVKREREIKLYSITRRWRTPDKKLEEEYTITENGHLLDENEKSYFENYLYSTLPPKLFEFFLFDGEEVGTLFSTEGYHQYVRDALLTLCGMDVFSSIRKFCDSFVDKSGDEETDAVQTEYQESLSRIKDIQTSIQADQDRLEECSSEIEALQSEIESIESRFLTAGGIPDSEKKKMQTQEAKKEKLRSALASELKAFAEETMPFYIIRSMIPALEEQLQLEEKLAIYDYVRNMLPQSFLQEQLQGKCTAPEQAAAELYAALLHRIGPRFDDTSSSERILDLSRDDVSRIDRVIESVEHIDPDEIVNKIKKKNQYSADIIRIHQRMKNALTEEDAVRFRSRLETARAQVQALQTESTALQTRLESSQGKLAEAEAASQQQYQRIMSLAQDRHIYELSSGISNVMYALIDQKTRSIRQKLADYTLNNLNEIYRKDNLIAHIEISESFKFHLYQMQDFNISELQALLSNVGTKEFVNQLGSQSIEILKQYYHTDDDTSLLTVLKDDMHQNEVFHLYQHIELSRLSKGERQIFILALYWAMVQISEKEIPFVIDTPYARIDANHRAEISKKFFPQISSQVIILSTDEEITEEYYRILKPYIAKEYLLSNSQGGNRTTVENRYFFEV